MTRQTRQYFVFLRLVEYCCPQASQVIVRDSGKVDHQPDAGDDDDPAKAAHQGGWDHLVEVVAVHDA